MGVGLWGFGLLGLGWGFGVGLWGFGVGFWVLGFGVDLRVRKFTCGNRWYVNLLVAFTALFSHAFLVRKLTRT